MSSRKEKHQKRSWSFRQTLGVVLIIVGIVLLVMFFAPNPNISRNVASSQEIVQNSTPEQLAANQASEAEYDWNAIENIDPTAAYIDPSSFDPELIIGSLVFPNIDINLTLFKGLNNDILHAGVGTMREDQVMGQGNYPIAGHYDIQDLLFGRLTWLKEGDVIRLTDKNTIYEYVVVANDVVDASSVHLITDEYAAEEYGAPIISLMNCFYINDYFDTGDRYFVFGELVNETSYDENKMSNPDFNWDSEEEKAHFEANNPTDDPKHSFDEHLDNQWQEREEFENQQ